MENNKNVAYLRELRHTNQCELAFKLKLTINDFVLEEEFRAVRKINDTIDSLQQHIKNKIVNKLKNHTEISEIINNKEIYFTNGNKKLNSTTVLKTLCTRKNRPLIAHIIDEKYVVLINAPLVRLLVLPSFIYADGLIEPKQFKTAYTNKNSSKFFWYKSQDKTDWKLISRTFGYRVKHEDVDYYLKLVCIPWNNQLKGPACEAVTEVKVAACVQIPKCLFDERHKLTEERLSRDEFRVISYNILSMRYSENNDSNPFPYCPNECLVIDYRKQLTSKELLGYNADIICLQEVDSKPYTSYYKNLFEANNYGSFFNKKGNRMPEGLACIFNKTRYKLLNSSHLVLSEEIQNNKLYAYLWNLIKSNQEVKALFLKQVTSLQITVLKDKLINRIVIVANTHLFYHPNAGHIRLIQINMATTYLNTIKRQYEQNDSNNVVVIFCGDFNCLPSSSVLKYLTNKEVCHEDEDFKRISDKNNVRLFHRFDFTSACGLPKYTNYTKDFKGCLDYIFIENSTVAVKEIIPFPTEDELNQFEGLPNEVHPSDHLALVVDLKFC